MTLEKAIEHLEHVEQRAKREGNMGTCIAAELGIEALKFRLSLEQEDPEITLEPLPRETKE